MQREKRTSHQRQESCNIFNSSESYTVSGTIIVYGGEFVGYDPSTGDDNMGGNFVASGKKVTEENGIYTVA